MTSRPSLPATSSDFALHPSAAQSELQSGPANDEDFNPLIMRFRRPSLLAPPRAGFFSEGRLHSPLMNSVTIPLSRRHSTSVSGEESESDREKMWTDSPPSVDSGATTPSTPALAPPEFIGQNNKSTSSVDSDMSMKSTAVTPNEIGLKTDRPSTPPRLSRFPDVPEGLSATKTKRMSHSLKSMPRIQTLLAESHLQENEVKSEAQFQRFVASFSELPRTPRAASDRGRYPEEADVEEPTREDTPSDDEVEPSEEPPYPFAGGGSEPISILGKRSSSVAPSLNGDEFSLSGLSESPGTMAMDVDLSRPPSACGSPKLSSSWRYTPPPTSSAVRTSKRKRTLDERYDPYPTSAKRRAVSPSISYLRDNQPNFLTPRTPNGNGRSMPHPIAIPVPLNPSASSPVVSMNGSRPLSWGPQNVMSSPTLRAQIGLASPVLRPMMRRREEREVDGANEGVNGLTLE